MKLIKIGRSSENDIVIGEDSNVSRNHAEIFEDDEGRIFLTDLDSANGTFINGKKLKRSELLKKNDIVKIGKTVLPWRNYIIADYKISPSEHKPINKIKMETNNENTNLEAKIMENPNHKEKKGFTYKYLQFNDEYISGNQYFGRSFLSFLLCFFLIGFYMLSVSAYKRAKSLQNSDQACKIWAIWGGLVPILAFTPISFFTNTIPHWYLWFSNGPGKKIEQ